MRTVYDIAKAELQVLFYSPIAWIILLLYTFQVGYGFMEGYVSFVYSQEMFGEAGNLTHLLFSSGYAGIYNLAMKYLYLYIPLLTMNLMSREYVTGSIKMLYSSPVSNGQIILGKFLSMVIFVGMLMGVLAVYVVLCGLTVENLDIPAVLVGLLGVFLVTCTYAAIGLYMSTLTSYQIIAALGTLAVLTFLHYVGGMWQEVAFVRDLTYWLSVRGRADEMIVGLLCSEDLLYFILVTYFFLQLSILFLRVKRQKVECWKVIRSYGVLIIGVFLFGFLTSRPVCMSFYDATRFKTNTLTPASQEILKQLEGGLTLTTYSNLMNEDFSLTLPVNINTDKRRFRQYTRFKPEMEMNYVYYYDSCVVDPSESIFPGLSFDERVRKFAETMGVDLSRYLAPVEIRKMVDLRGEEGRFVRQFKRENGESSFLRIYSDMLRHPQESEISASLKRLVRKPPLVGCVRGHGERNVWGHGLRGYSMFTRQHDHRYSLINQGFDVKELTLESPLIDSVDILLVAEPREPFSEREMDALEKYVERGGDLIVLTNPGREHAVAPVLRLVGVRQLPGTLVRLSKELQPNVVLAKTMREACDLSYIFRGTTGIYRVAMEGVAGLEMVEDKGFVAVPLLTCDSLWNELQVSNFEDSVPVYDSDKGEIMGQYQLMLALRRNVGEKEQRIIVSGDADFISNGGLLATYNLKTAPVNYEFLMGMFNWLSHGDLPIDVRRPASIDNAFEVSSPTADVLYGCLVWGLPLFLFVFAMILWMRRRGK